MYSITAGEHNDDNIINLIQKDLMTSDDTNITKFTL